MGDCRQETQHTGKSMIREYKKASFKERGIKDIRYRIGHAMWHSFPRYIPYFLWVYLSCVVIYALWDKHDLRSYTTPQYIHSSHTDTPSLGHMLKPFSFGEAAIAPVTVFFKDPENDADLPVKKSLVIVSWVLSLGAMMLLLWIARKVPLPAPVRPVAEYYGIIPLTRPYYQEYFEKTLKQLETEGMENEVDATCKIGVEIRTQIANKFENEGGEYPHMIHLAVQQYLCADEMFRTLHRDKWLETVMYENTSCDGVIELCNRDKTMPYPPACRVLKNLILDLDIGQNRKVSV
jgi:hypothetical protein